MGRLPSVHGAVGDLTGIGDIFGNSARPLISSAEMLGVEPASQELIETVAQRRSIAWATPGSEEERLLNYFGAEASVSSNELGEQGMPIILKPNPSKPAVLEEFLHGTQHSPGLPDEFGTDWSEVYVKSFMLRHQDMLGIGEEDADVLRALLQRDIGDLNTVKAAQPEKYFKPIALPPGR